MLLVDLKILNFFTPLINSVSIKMSCVTKNTLVTVEGTNLIVSELIDEKAALGFDFEVENEII